MREQGVFVVVVRLVVVKYVELAGGWTSQPR